MCDELSIDYFVANLNKGYFNMSKSNLLLKNKLLNNGLYDLFLKNKLALYSDYCSNTYDNCYFNERLRSYLNIAFYDYMTDEEYLECERIFNSFRKRTSRLRKRIECMLSNSDCIFLTLTFTDDIFIKTSIDTRHRYVTRFLNLLNCDYVGNIDFGKLNGREHYHALVNCNLVNCNSWSYGSINFKRVVNKNSLAIAKYIAKLTNHAIKSTTKNSKIIYSRKRR